VEEKVNVRLSPAGINKKILIFAALVVATAVFLRPLQLSILERLDSAKNYFIGQVEESLGRKLKYGTIRPSFFGELDIRDITILREDNSESLSVSRLRLSYSLFDIIRGNILNSFKSVRIDRPVLSLDFRLDADLLERFSSLGTGEASVQNTSLSFRELLPENFSIRIWDGEWELSDSGGSLRIHSVGVDASLRRLAITFQGRWAASASVSGDRVLAAFSPSASSTLFEADMRGQINGEYSGETGEGSAVITIPSFAGDFFSFNPLSFNLFLSGGRLEILKTYDRSPAAFSLVYDPRAGTFRSRLEGENFSPSDFLTFTGAWSELNPALAFRVSGNAVFEKESSDDLQFSVNFSGAGSGIYPDNTFLNSAFLEIKAAGSASSVNIENFTVRSPNGSLDFQGGLEFDQGGLYQTSFSTIAPYGDLSLSNFRFHGDSGISGDLHIRTNGSEIGVYSGNLAAGSVRLSSMDLSVITEDNGLGFVFSVLESSEQKSDNMNSYIGSSDNTGIPSMRLTGSLDYEPRQVQANLLLDSFPVGNIFSFVEPLAPLSIPRALRSAADDLFLTTEVFFSTDYEHILYNAPNVEAIYEGLFDILAVASLSGTDRGIDLNTCRVSFGNETAEIIGSADFSDINDISLFLETSFGNLTYLFDGMILDQSDVSIRGSYGLQVSFSSGMNGSLSGFARGDGIPIPAGISDRIPFGIFPVTPQGGERYATLGFLFSVVRDSPSSWRAVAEKFELTGLATPNTTNASLRFTGEANERGLVISDMVFDDGRGSLAGKINLDWDAAYENFTFAADIAGNSYNEIYNLAGTYMDKKLQLSLSGQRVQFNHFTTRNAVADGSLRLSWESHESFEAEAVVSSFALYHQNEVIRASASFSVNHDEFIARQTRINFAGLEAYLPFLKIDREAANAEAELQISGRFTERPVEIFSTGKAAFSSSATWIDLFRNFGSLDGALNIGRALYDTVEAEPFDFAFTVRQENSGFSLGLNGGPRNMVRFRYNPETADSGAFYAALSAPSPVRGTVTGTVDSNYIDASTSDLYIDMAALWRFIPPLDFLAFPGGIVTASIRVAGPFDEPEFFGNARGTSLQILVPQYLPDPIRPVPVNVSLNGYEMSFGPVDAVVGQGRGTVSGWARFDQWIPNTFAMGIQVPQNSPIPYDLDISGILANGLVYGNLDMSLEDFVFYLKGELTAQDTEISLNSNELGAQESRPSTYEEPFISMISDIALRAGRRVDFFWPSVDFPMLQASADLGTGIHITTDAIAQRYTMIGDVKLRSGEIFYLERNFYIREGTLIFRENETQFDPFITARAELRDQADIGPVTISMMIDNAPLRSFTPRFISSPSLSQMEIYSILGQNPQGAGDSRNLATSAFFDSLAQFTVIGRLQRQVRNFLGLDMLSLRTQLFQNMLISVSGGRLSGNSTGREYRVGNYFDNTTVFVGKFFGAELFGEAMFSLKYDENRLDWGGLVIEPEFGLEMRNPLFDIRFTMVPTHPENMYIDDVSFSFIWRRTF
jgi:hypothetical protein